MANRLDKAKAARSATATAVAAQTRQAASGKKAAWSSVTPITLERIALNLPSDVIRQVDRRLFELRDRTGRKISTSAFFESAARALLERDDLEAVLTRFGAAARRSPQA